MRVLIAFIVAFVIGAASRWTGVPSLAPQAIVGALLIVAMSTGYVSAERLLKRNPSPPATSSVSTCATAELATHNREVILHEPSAVPRPEADTVFWRQKSEALQLIIADLLLRNEQLRASEDTHSSKAPASWREKHTYPLTRNHDMKQHDWPLVLGFLLVGSLCLL